MVAGVHIQEYSVEAKSCDATMRLGILACWTEL